LCLDSQDPNNCDLYFLYTVQTSNTFTQYFKLIPSTAGDSSVKELKPTPIPFSSVAAKVQLGQAPSFNLSYGYYPSY